MTQGGQMAADRTNRVEAGPLVSGGPRLRSSPTPFGRIRIAASFGGIELPLYA